MSMEGKQGGFYKLSVSPLPVVKPSLWGGEANDEGVADARTGQDTHAVLHTL